jgi:hypothetical protein
VLVSASRGGKEPGGGCDGFSSRGARAPGCHEARGHRDP